MPHPFECKVCGYKGNIFTLGWKDNKDNSYSPLEKKVFQYRKDSQKTYRLSGKVLKHFKIELKKYKSKNLKLYEALTISNQDQNLKRLIGTKWIAVKDLSKKNHFWFNVNRLPKSGPIYVLAGEWDLFAFWEKTGIDGLCSLFGEGSIPQRQSDYDLFKGRDVIIIYDCDSAGKQGAEKLKSAILKKVNANVNVISLDPLFTDNELAEKPDIDDYFFKYGGAWERLQDLIIEQSKTKEIEKEENIYTTLENALNNFYEFRKNIVTDKIEFKEKNNGKFKPLTDYEENSIVRKINTYLMQKGKRRLPKSFIDEQINTCEISPEFDPFNNYFDTLPEYDNENHIEKLFNTMEFKDKDSRDIYYDWFKRWLIGAYAQATLQGQNQQALILQGEQGIGKTTFLNSLAFDSFYLHTGAINPDSKDDKFFLATKFLINLDELGATTRGDKERLKSLMTLKEFDERRPYARYPVSLKRRASFCGSINDPTFLDDLTGNRRWLIIEIVDIDLEKLKSIDMNQVWAQAKALFHSGEKYWFDKEDVKVLNERNKQYEIERPEQELLLKKYRPTKQNEKPDFELSATEIVNDLQDDNKFIKLNIRTMGKILAKNGFKRSLRKNNKRGWLLMGVDATDTESPQINLQ
jgi:predicted P-loop ATPase